MPKPALPTLKPAIRLFGQVGENMLSEFFRQQSETGDARKVVLELSTPGGDADIGRRIADELRLWQASGTTIYFLGKTYIYSAGVTVMSAIPPPRRFLTCGTEILIHERKMKKDIHLEGALRSCRTLVNDALAEIESGQRLEREGFSRLVEGTTLTVDDIEKRVLDKDWYLTAAEAVDLGLVAGTI